jgi:hypothetical protein
MQSFRQFMNEEIAGQRGLDYEMKIYNAIKKSSVSFFTPGAKPAAGFSNVGAGDIEGTLNGKSFNIEVKLSADDQMGGGSFNYDLRTKTFTPAKQMDPADEELLLSAVKQKTQALDNYILAAQELEPTKYHKDIKGIPIKVAKSARDELKARGLLKDINTKVITDASFIEKHYNKKGVYYIQIGGAGLFYLGRNPFNLPIPRLKGEIQVEIRLAYSGTKGAFPDGTETRTAGLRFQGRLRTKGRSPHTIDTVAGIEKLFLKDWNKK